MQLRQIIIVAIALGIIGFGFFSMKFLSSQKEEPPQRPAAEVKRFVKTRAVAYGNISTAIETNGRVLSGQRIALIAEVSGKIRKGDVSLKPGQAFNKGQLLYKIDDTESAYNLSAQKSQYLNALALILPDLKLDYTQEYASWQSYFDKINITKDLPDLPEVGNSQLKTFLANKGILNQYYSIKAAEERLRKYNYYAPFDGAIISTSLEAGSIANTGARIGEIIQTGEIEVEIPVKSTDVQWIKKGTIAIVLAPDSIRGKVTRISDFLDPNTQSVNVYVSVSHKGLYEGMYVDVIIPGPNVENAMEVPRKAIFNDGKVYLVKEGKLAVQKVNIQKTTPETAVISGLVSGEILVVEPLVNATDGMPVEPIKEGK